MSYSANELDVAIVGMAGRFPGAKNIDAFWENLVAGKESVTFFSDEDLLREGVNPALLKNPKYVRAASILDDVDIFDADFFGYSGLEAARLDPQSRLFLECAWEALECAGYAPFDYEGAIGVYASQSMNTYLLRNLHSQLALDEFTLSYQNIQHVVTNLNDFLATRVSYKLNLKGPSIDVQCACSSSLVAVHLACQSLINGECQMALAGGVSLYLPQERGYLYEEGMILSPDGHCRPFDADANGTIFGRGVGIVVLKLLEDAVNHGDTVYAVIKGSAINNDGANKVGFTAPGMEGQARVIAEALAVSGVSAETISYIEAHGTATTQGDPIEVAALTRAFRNYTDKNGYCALGTVKSNIGHLDAAAGITGLIKTALMLRNKKLPASLHYRKPNPQIDFEHSPFYVCKSLKAWDKSGGPRRAGVSAFGMGGTNAHVVLEEAPEATHAPAKTDRPTHILTLSAKNEKALKRLAERYVDHLERGTSSVTADICFTSNNGRSHFDHRLAIVADTNEALRIKLAAFNSGAASDGAAGVGRKTKDSPRLTFLFTGQGSQSVGMGRRLYETQPTFRKALDRCDEVLRTHLEKPLLSVLYPQPGEESPLNETAYTQPALFALEYALYELWRSWGVEPSVVMGHSVGEYVAACVAGVFSLEDGLMLIAERGRLIQALPKNGEMAAVFASEDRVAAALTGHTDNVSIAVVNGPENTVISGVRESIGRILEELEAEGIVAQRLNVSHAFHSPLMEPMLDAFERAASKVTYSLPRIGLMSNVTGSLVTGNEVCTPAYWRRHVRAPVRFYRSMQALHEHGEGVFLELGPHPVLLGMGAQCLPRDEGVWLPSLRRGQDDWQQILNSLGELYVRGTHVNWEGFDRDYSRRKINLPSYPFQRERCWITSDRQKPQVAAERRRGVSSNRPAHPLLGQRLLSALKEIQFEGSVSLRAFPFVRDHRFYETAMFPAAAFMEMAMAAGAEALSAEVSVLEDVAFMEALTLDDHNARTVQLVLGSEGAGSTPFQIFSLNDEEEERMSWRLHVTGRIRPDRKQNTAPASDSLQLVQARCRDELPAQVFYQELRELGVDYGSSMQGIERLWRGNGEALGQLRLPEGSGLEADACHLHPVILDSCLQLVGAIMLKDTGANPTHDVYIPFALDSLRVHEKPDKRLWGHARIRDGYESGAETLICDVFLLDGTGRTVAEMAGLRLKRASREALQRAAQTSPRAWAYEVDWQSRPLAEADHSRGQTPQARHANWLIFADKSGIGENLGVRLGLDGVNCVMVYPAEKYEAPEERHYGINPTKAEDFDRMFREAQVWLGQGPLAVVHLWSLDVELLKETVSFRQRESQELSCASVLHLVQTLAKARSLPSTQLWLVTRGAQTVLSTRIAPALSQTPLLGFGTAIGLELPDLHCTRIDLDPADEKDDGVEELFKEIRSKDLEDQVAFRNSMRYVPRLILLSASKPGQSASGTSGVGTPTLPLEVPPRPASDNSAGAFRADGTYLITGGLGGLGLLVARWMGRRGARHLILVGRGEGSEKARGVVEELRQEGIQVLVRQADVSREEQVAKVLAEIGDSGFLLRGIVHCAGVIDDGMLLQQSWERFAGVLAPKAEGAWNLHRLTLSTPLDFFVLFSSGASLLGSVGQASYAAANSFLDGLAHYRRAKGLAALSINWGPWAGVGMAAGLDEREHGGWARQGIVLIEPDQGIQMLEMMMQQDRAQVVALPIHWSKLLRQFPRGGQPSLLAEIAQRSRLSGEFNEVPAEVNDFRGELEHADPEDRRDLLLDHICGHVIKVLRLSPSFELRPDQGLTDLGMDSLLAVELVNRLKSSLGCSLPPTLAFERPTIAAICDHLLNDVLGLAAAERSPSGKGTKETAEQAREKEELESLSEEEAEKTLTAELERAGY